MKLARFSLPRKSRLLAIIHTCLAVSIPILIVTVAGCNENGDTEPVDYGPQTDVASINSALSAPIANMDPDAIHVGQFFHTTTSQDVGAGAAVQLSSESGYTVFDRQDSSSQVRFLVEENNFTYNPNGTYSKVTRQHDALLTKRTQSAPKPTPAPSPGASFTGSSDQSNGPSNGDQSTPDPNVATPFSTTQTSNSPLASILSQVQAQDSAQTYHRLRTWSERVPVPAMVQKRVGCAGVPGCMITIYHISYNIVTWDPSGPILIQVEHVRSPDVPYFAAEMQSCATGLVPIGTTNSKVLLKQCNTVVDFCFDSCSAAEAP